MIPDGDHLRCDHGLRGGELRGDLVVECSPRDREVLGSIMDRTKYIIQLVIMIPCLALSINYMDVSDICRFYLLANVFYFVSLKAILKQRSEHIYNFPVYFNTKT